jgi:isocitrate dehydrogenase
MGGLRKGWIKALGTNIGDVITVFEAMHGRARRSIGQDQVNSASMVLPGCMMFEYLGGREATALITSGVSTTMQQKRMTYD